MQVLLQFSTLEVAQDETIKHAALAEQTASLTGWLEGIGMEKYANTFLEAGYELDTILEVGLTDEDMDFLQIKVQFLVIHQFDFASIVVLADLSFVYGQESCAY